MNFIHDMPREYELRIMRRDDGSIDREHYEIRARRERARAARAFWQKLVRPFRQPDVTPARRRPAYREA